MVPRAIQYEVWNQYRLGQCDDKRPSREWHEAADAAIGFVSMREGGGLTPLMALALVRRGYADDVIESQVRRKGEAKREDIIASVGRMKSAASDNKENNMIDTKRGGRHG
jgi:hypothetical protein